MTARAVEVAGRWAACVEIAGTARTTSGSAEVAGRTAGRAARGAAEAAAGPPTTGRIAGSVVAGRRTAGPTATWAALHPWAALWRGVCNSGSEADGCGAESAADGGSSYKLTEFHYQAFPRR